MVRGQDLRARREGQGGLLHRGGTKDRPHLRRAAGHPGGRRRRRGRGLRARGLAGRLISRSQGASAPSYYHHDAVGSVVGLSDSTGALTDSYTYDAFGGELSRTGTTDQPYRYLGNRYEPSTGLYDSHARHYSPSTGRFLSKDPVRGSKGKPQTLNPYACSANSPLAHPDPSGLYPDDYYGEDGSGGEDTSSEEEDTSSDGEEYTGEEEATSPEEEGSGGGDCSQYIPESAEVPSEEDYYVPSEDREAPVQENIRDAEEFESSYPAYVPGATNAYFFFEEAPYIGANDYKNSGEEDSLYDPYADYGNFNFGAEGAALGYDEETLLQTGGADQPVTEPGSSSPSEIYDAIQNEDLRPLDHYDDQEQIQAGYDYYDCLKESGF